MHRLWEGNHIDLLRSVSLEATRAKQLLSLAFHLNRIQQVPVCVSYALSVGLCDLAGNPLVPLTTNNGVQLRVCGFSGGVIRHALAFELLL